MRFRKYYHVEKDMLADFLLDISMRMRRKNVFYNVAIVGEKNGIVTIKVG